MKRDHVGAVLGSVGILLLVAGLLALFGSRRHDTTATMLRDALGGAAWVAALAGAALLVVGLRLRRPDGGA